MNSHNNYRTLNGYESGMYYELINYEHFMNDIITPLSVIYMSIQQLEKNQLRKETVSRHLDIIKSNWFQIMKVVNDMCDSRRILNGTLRPTIHKVDLAAIMRDIADYAKLLSERKSIRLEYICRQNNCVVYTDKKIFERIVLNMLAYAFRQCDDGGTICVTLAQRDDSVVFCVEDTTALGANVSDTLLNADQSHTPLYTASKGYMWQYIVHELSLMLNANVHYGPQDERLSMCLTLPLTYNENAEREQYNTDVFYNDNIYQFELGI